MACSVSSAVLLKRRRRPACFDFGEGEIGPDLFRAACHMGLEGLVSKRRDRSYQGGRSKHWVKIKNRKHPATSRLMEAFVRLPLSAVCSKNFGCDVRS